MSKIIPDQEKTLARYPKIRNEDAFREIVARLAVYAEAKKIERDLAQTAYAIYVGLSYLRSLYEDSSKYQAIEIVKSAVSILNFNGGNKPRPSSCFDRHADFIKFRCSSLFPDVKSEHKRCAVLLYIGCTTPLEFTAPEYDDWMKDFTFNT